MGCPGWGLLSSYDRAATRVLVRAIRATAPGHIKVYLLQRPGAHPRGPHDLVRRSRRPHPRPLLPEVVHALSTDYDC